MIRIDPHAHLYDTYSVREWCEAACSNLGGIVGVLPVVIVVDREGQNSFSRFRAEVPLFGSWAELSNGLVGTIKWRDRSMVVVQGVQYVARERIEVLGLGVSRRVADGAPAAELIELINEEGGLACLPWSPGKWLGARGRVVRKLLDTYRPTTLTVGDIAIRSSMGPPSTLLLYAKGRGYQVLCGSDPLPRRADQRMVGSYGVEIATLPDGELLPWLLKSLRAGALRRWGDRNTPWLAAWRFFS